jgi:hypothetical protein
MRRSLGIISDSFALENRALARSGDVVFLMKVMLVAEVSGCVALLCPARAAKGRSDGWAKQWHG